MKKALYFIVLLSVAAPTWALTQDAPIFPKGEKSTNVHNVGDVWLHHLSNADSIFKYNIAVATFAPGARLDWHIHPGGQQLLITAGVGYYQERNKPLKTVHKGDVVRCQPGVEHWHGATPDNGVTYLAITAPQPTKWLERVSDETYFSNKKSSASSLTTEQQLIELSKQKWQWMADKNTDTLASLFHEKSVFVHMGGAWGKDRELEIIKSGGIHYKKADIHEVSVNVMDNTAILLNKITLLAVVGGNEVTNPFMVTETYVKESGTWKLGSMSFTKLLSPADIQKPSEAEDRIALKNLVDTFSILADRKEVQQQALLFTEDAVVESVMDGQLTSTLKGRKQIGEGFANFLNRFETVYHLNGQQTLTLNGDKASGISYCYVVLIGTENGKKFKTEFGVYYNDEYVRVGKKWLISHRKSTFAWQDKRELGQ